MNPQFEANCTADTLDELSLSLSKGDEIEDDLSTANISAIASEDSSVITALAPRERTPSSRPDVNFSARFLTPEKLVVKYRSLAIVCLRILYRLCKGSTVKHRFA